jgi:hypothetical protein
MEKLTGPEFPGMIRELDGGGEFQIVWFNAGGFYV